MVVNSVKQVKKIISQHFTDFNIEEIKYLGEGANNCVYEVNNIYLFRFPKNLKAEKDCCKEIYLLNSLQPYLNLVVPNIEFIGNKTKLERNLHSRKFLLSPLLEKIESKLNKYWERVDIDSLKITFSCYDKIFVGYKKIKGEELWPEDFEQFSLEQKENIAKQISHFLLSIHNLVKPSKSTDINIPVWNFDQEYYLSIYQGICQYIAPELSPGEFNTLSSFYTSYMNQTTLYQYSPCLIHGDLCCDHIFFYKHDYPIGFIDFGASCLGDPDYDFFLIYNDYGIELLNLVFKYYNRNLTLQTVKKILAFWCGSVAFTFRESKEENNVEKYEYSKKSLQKLIVHLDQQTL